MIDITENYIFRAVITTDFFNSVIFKTALEIARENNYPCFFIVDDSSILPDDWHKGLNILFLEYYDNRVQLQSLTNEMIKEIHIYNNSLKH